jgi:hypothetical protein
MRNPGLDTVYQESHDALNSADKGEASWREKVRYHW